MAHLNYHGKIVRRWRAKNEAIKTCYHLTETNWLLVSFGPRRGRVKVQARPSEKDKRDRIMHYLSNSDVWQSELIYGE